eukprot:TRINITY_DN1858_c0_g1_i3.p1 TRINITY_DN1858_c0_g1~~TRINITY_DN1858_c0_g1_i3.p1  ORF type:complete len:593 (+),score=238.02 TRINITY_DN1858_c0_g1_i3:233-2011(+)
MSSKKDLKKQLRDREREREEQKQLLADLKHEEEADALRETIRKEVKDADDLRAAIESVERSIGNERETAEALEKERRALVQKAHDLRARAKELGELIKAQKKARHELTGGQESDSEEEEGEEEEDDNLEFILTKHGDTQAPASSASDPSSLQLDLEMVFAELRGNSLEEMASIEPVADTRLRQRALTISRAMTEILSQPRSAALAASVALAEVRRDDERSDAQYRHHLRVLRRWIDRETAHPNAAIFASAGTKQDVSSDVAAAVVRVERDLVRVLDQVIENALKPLVAARASSQSGGGSEGPRLTALFSNALLLRSLHNNLATLVEEGTDVLAVASVLHALPDAFSQFVLDRAESKELLAMEAVAEELEAAGAADAPALDSVLDSIVEKIEHYPSSYQTFLDSMDANSDEFAELADCITCISRALLAVGLRPPAVTSLHAEKQKLVELQARIDWCGAHADERDLSLGTRRLVREGTFTKAVTAVGAKQSHVATYKLYLFTDVLLVARPSMYAALEWFKAFYPLEALVVWDVPDRTASVNKHEFELVWPGMKGSKTIVSAQSEGEKSEWIEALNDAIFAATANNTDLNPPALR